MTIQTLFDRMMLYDNQLGLLAADDDVTRGLAAVNLVQDWFEARAALRQDILQTDETFTTTANTEKTAWPARLIRMDAFFHMDGGVQGEQIEPLDRVGGHRRNTMFPFRVSSQTLQYGKPSHYRARGQGGSIYWQPTPDDVYTVRAYGLWTVADYTAAANTFGYPDSAALALVPWAVKVMRAGLDRSLVAVHEASTSALDDALDVFSSQGIPEPIGMSYTEYHDT